jgi:peptidoglycan/xylan/chitin deacetylase (PgdA/CDA1 family)
MVTSEANPETNVDDLCYTQDTRENFDRLVKALADNDMPATVTFIAGRSFDPVLETEWLKSGNLVGNFTFDGRKAKKGNEQELVENIARNDHLLASVWKAFPPKKKYFRHPHPKTMSDAQDRVVIAAYLKQNGYVEASSTIESPDPLFSEMYCDARAKGNTECANLIKANFFSLLLDKTLKARADARDAAGREIKHVLAIRASQLTCDTLAEMLVWFKGLGARFISLEDALSDPFYAGSGARDRATSDPPASKK